MAVLTAQPFLKTLTIPLVRGGEHVAQIFIGGSNTGLYFGISPSSTEFKLIWQFQSPVSWTQSFPSSGLLPKHIIYYINICSLFLFNKQTTVKSVNTSWSKDSPKASTQTSPNISLTSFATGRSKYDSRVEVDFDCLRNTLSMLKKNVNNSVVTLRPSSKSTIGGPACTRNVACLLIILIIRI